MIKNNVKEYQYIIDRYYRRSHLKLIDTVHDVLLKFFENDQTVHFLCSWFCEIDVMKLQINNFNDYYFYDFDKTVCDYNLQVTDKIKNVDIIFDDVNINEQDNIFVHKYCEYTFPIKKRYNGEFILVGCDDNSLHICNPIKSCEQLIEQNQITQVYGKHSWKILREYDYKRLNYYMVVGCNT